MKHLTFLITDLMGGGAEKALVELLRSIDHKEYEISLCLTFYRGVYLEDIPEEVKIIYLFRKRFSFSYILIMGWHKFFRSMWLFSLLMKIKMRHHYDAIISTEGFSLLLHSFIADKAQKNISWTHCDLYNHHYTASIFHKPGQELECYRKMDELIFVSQGALANFDKLFQVNASKHLIYNIVNTDSILDVPDVIESPKQCFTITAIGSLIPVKGFDRLIRVARMLKDSGHSFCIQILGEGMLRDELIDLRDKLGLQEEILFLGFKKPPYPYLKQSDILVSTSISEGLPYCICEALVLGIPVVATKTAGAMELLEENQYGVLVEHDDFSIYQGIKSLLDSEEQRRMYQEKGIERSKLFSKENTMNRFLRLINS